MSKTNSVSYYRDKLKVYLAQMNSVDVFGMIDQSQRHKAIDAQIDLLTKLKPLLSTVSQRIEKRDAEGLFPELKTFIKHIDYLKKYTDEYTMERMEFINSQLPEKEQVVMAVVKQIEAKKQLEIIQKIENFDNFVENLIDAGKPNKKTTDVFDGVSLADLRII